MMEQKSCWIWIAGSNPKETEWVAFYRNLEVIEKTKTVKVHISADSRYKLYINGEFVEFGPSKGNGQCWYYDEIEINHFLNFGMNEIKIVVLHYSIEHWKGNCSTFRTETPGLYFDVFDEGSEGKVIWGEWRCKRLDSIELCQENPYFAPLWFYEIRKDSHDDKPEDIIFYDNEEIYDCLRKEQLKKRTIPFMYRQKKYFPQMGRLKVKANDVVQFVLDAGELQTAFLKLSLSGGAGAKIKILQSESYAGNILVKEDDPYGSLPQKGNRIDSALNLYGYTDVYSVSGRGREEEPEIYEPFWMRTFRFIQITITTKSEPLELLDFSYEETGYPIDVQTRIQVSDERMSSIWDISERSLRRCMQETYIDCPFYEQLQYAMDSRSQILYTYAIAADSRLAIKCMDDFSQAVLDDGMINCSYPNYEQNVIPGFGIYFVGMVYDYMMYFGDKKRIRKYIPTITGILDFFQQNLLDNGLVGKVGGLNRPGNYWSFIDWTKEWDDTNGVPPCTLKGPITMESLLYILGLDYAYQIEKYIGRLEKAEEYKQRKELVQSAVRNYCIGDNGMIQDGPAVEEYSQHCQVFGVLTNTIDIQQGKTAIEKTLNDTEKYSQCSIAMMYYLFRALEKCQSYGRTYGLWDIWDNMVENHLTTCAEDQLGERSDCHAWGALALYELPAVILGVRPGKPGYEEIVINPNTSTLSWAKGSVITPKGIVKVEWKKKINGKTEMKVDTSALAADVKITIQED